MPDNSWNGGVSTNSMSSNIAITAAVCGKGWPCRSNHAGKLIGLSRVFGEGTDKLADCGHYMCSGSYPCKNENQDPIWVIRLVAIGRAILAESPVQLQNRAWVCSIETGTCRIGSKTQKIPWNRRTVGFSLFVFLSISLNFETMCRFDYWTTVGYKFIEIWSMMGLTAFHKFPTTHTQPIQSRI